MLQYSAGVDWLTTTWPMSWKDTPLPSMPQVADWARRRARATGGGEWLKAWAWQGYHGYQVGGLCYGEKLDSTIVRISSGAAQDFLAAGFPTGHNISRLDVQATFWGESDQDHQISLHNEQAVAARRAHEGRPIKIRYVKGNGDGDTLYLGSRASETFIRIYNKEAEQRPDDSWKGAIRYEVEFKDERAKRALETLRDRAFSSRVAASVVGHELNYRGVVVPYRPDMDGAVVRSVPLPRTGVEDSLRWLETQVAPTVRRLLSEVDRERIMAALGLSV